MRTYRLALMAVFAVATSPAAVAAETPQAAIDGTSADIWGGQGGAKTASARGAWLKDSRFAMFVHWGLYSELGGRWQDKTYYGIAEWIMNRAKIPVAEYEQVAGRFNPTEFHAAEWVQLAKDAGMRHIMIGNWKSPREIAERLVRVVSRGGTYMLNVGPDGKGRIPAQSARILRQVGQWVHAHEAAIHGADPTPFGQLAWGECTARGNTLYLHIFQWPEDGRLVVPGLKTPVQTARLEAGSELAIDSAAEYLSIALPASRPDTLIPVVTVDLAGPPAASRDQFVLNGYRQTLESGVAELAGCERKPVNWMEKFGDWKHAECLGGWQGSDSSATWEFRTVAPGSFYLDVEYTCPAEDDYSEWRVRCGETDATFPLIDSGERTQRTAFGGALPRFRVYRVGVIDFPQAGAQQLTFGPTGTAGAGVRVSALSLTPVE